MTSSVLAQVVFHHKSGLVKDQVVNTFAFIVPNTPPVAADFVAIKDALADFYNTAPSGHNAIAAMISPCIDRVAPVQIKQFNIDGHLNGTAHGSPERVDTFTLEPVITSGFGYPSELAICLSFHGLFGDDTEFGPGTRPRSRERGRVYIGPLVRTTGDEDSITRRIFVNLSARESVLDAGIRLRGTAGVQWAVWSRKNAVLKTVAGCSVDDAFDVQRRRGEAPTLKISG